MKKLLSLLTLFLIAFCVNAQIENAIPARPNPPKLVNDFANLLTTEQEHALERKLVAYDDSTSNQIAIVIVNTTGDYPIEEVALRILRDWGIGNKNTNNGIVLLVAKDDRKIRIETGYGLEGAIPDITAKTIIDKTITPAFRKENYYRGLDEATDDIIKAAAGEYKAPKGYNEKKGKGIGKGIGGFLIVLFIIIFSIISRGGGRGGGMASRRGWGDIGTGWIIGSILGGMGRGGSGGGGWSGGGGGGFGGFGGGSGGGGGASGSW
jgi:uncharacterized protein